MEILRQLLNSMVSNEDTDPDELLKLSRELDNLICIYYGEQFPKYFTSKR